MTKYKCGGCNQIHNDNDFDPEVDVEIKEEKQMTIKRLDLPLDATG